MEIVVIGIWVSFTRGIFVWENYFWYGFLGSGIREFMVEFR